MAREAVKTIYHLAFADGWAAARTCGRYDGTADDHRDGFVHCSTAAQVAASAAKHRAGRDDVVLLWLDVGALGPALRWEPSRGGALFPHVHGDIPMHAVRRAEPLPLQPDGRHLFPALDGSPVLTVPGLDGSGPRHWQTRWERLHGYVRVEQEDWMRPEPDGWTASLAAAVAAAEIPVVLAAPSLGCAVVARWARAGAAGRVTGALLVAPADVDCERRTPAVVRGFAPMPLGPLPFPSVVVASRDDTYVELARAAHFAERWGARFVDAGVAGHLNADSQLGDWPDGHRLLEELLARSPA